MENNFKYSVYSICFFWEFELCIKVQNGSNIERNVFYIISAFVGTSLTLSEAFFLVHKM